MIPTVLILMAQTLPPAPTAPNPNPTPSPTVAAPATPPTTSDPNQSTAVLVTSVVVGGIVSLVQLWRSSRTDAKVDVAAKTSAENAGAIRENTQMTASIKEQTDQIHNKVIEDINAKLARIEAMVESIRVVSRGDEPREIVISGGSRPPDHSA